MSTWIGTSAFLGSAFVSAGGSRGSNISFAMLVSGAGTSVSVFASTLTSGWSLSDGAAVGGGGAGSDLAGSMGFSIEIGTSNVLGSVVESVFGAVAAALGNVIGFSGDLKTGRSVAALAGSLGGSTLATGAGVGNLPNEVVALGSVGTKGSVGTCLGGSTLTGSLGVRAGALPNEVVALGSVGTAFGGSFNNKSFAMLVGAGALPNEVVALGSGCEGVACCCCL
jgi:hypothetical protein